MSDTEKKKVNWKKVAETTVIVATTVAAAGKVLIDQIDGKSKQ